MEEASTERNLQSKENRFNIKVPNPKSDELEIKGKKKEKLILLDDKNNSETE